MVSCDKVRQWGKVLTFLHIIIPMCVCLWCIPEYCSANNFALKSKRKTISANDIFQALEDMELEDFVPELKNCLEGDHALIKSLCAFWHDVVNEVCFLRVIWAEKILCTADVPVLL